MKKKILVFFMLIAAFFFLITAPNNNDNSNNLIEIKEAEAVNNHTGGYIYFDNSKTQWSDSYIYLCIGHDSYTSLYKMTKVANTNLYYTELGVWDNATYCAIIGTSSSWGSGAWGPGNRTNASHYTNVYNDWTFNSGGNYLITTTSSTNNTGITIGYYANGVNHTVGVEKHSTDGIGINTVKVSGRKLSAGGNSLDAASSGTSVAIAYSTNATLTATVKDGYSFLGWYDSNGNRVSSDATCSVTVTAEKTYYARAYRILPSGESLYFIPNNAWKGNSARFAAYFYNHIGGSTWVNLSKGTNDYYSFSVPSGDWTNFKIVRMDPNNVANNWENDWSETAPLTFDGTKNLFFITSTNTTSGVETSCDSMILNLKTVYFATDASGWSNVYVKARLGAGSNPIDYETQMDIVNSLEGFDNATYDFYYSSTQTSSALTIFKAEIPVIYDLFNNLEFDNEDSFTDAYNVTHGFSEGDDGNQYIHYDDFDGKLFFYDKLDTNSGWKTKTSAIFHMNEPNTEARTVTAYGFSGEAVGAPSTNKIGDYVFAGWYDNEGCEGVSLSAPQLVANETNYYASWGIPFNSGTIYCIPNSTWLASGTVAVNMYGSGQNNWFNMNKHTNSDGTVIY